MKKLGEEIQAEEELRLEVPAYYGFASWKTATGQHRQALFMKLVEEPNLLSIDLQKASKLHPDLRIVLEQARNLGIEFSDLTAGNIFVKEEEDKKTYIIIDQA
ncbi:MAG: hypothetical protein HN981_03715 [Candidatus Pacebacteria bacterium]|jgi:hypothetical protein|nr:hypothetical protein [Candidatus Paceibacterota bacterium]MBT4652305.1 hypothetical protein [Candidatus Paceibacterota bacterium]MBT6756498.1 hypothetical protein [Candidatus Paceibacterota bacterium]MBT6921471.1 hypothetical protein [Candidatus Paceibacterota bacterium]